MVQKASAGRKKKVTKKGPYHPMKPQIVTAKKIGKKLRPKPRSIKENAAFVRQILINHRKKRQAKAQVLALLARATTALKKC